MALNLTEYVNFDWIGEQIKRFQFGSKSQLHFLEDLYVLVNDGIPPNRAIDMLTQIGTGINQEVAISISQKISEGQALAEGMRGWFAPNIIEIIRVGEEGGVLAETMRSAIKTLGERSATIGTLISAVSYPLLVIAMACGIIVYLDSSVFTQFAQIKPMDQWPDAGRTLVSLAALIKKWWWMVIIAIVAIIIAFRQVMINYVGELRPILDQFPPFNLYRRLAAARLLETLGLLVSNGVVFKNAIRVMEYQANPYVASHLIMMEHLLSTGRGNIADVLATGLVSNNDLVRLRVMAEVKGFEHGLIRMGVMGTDQTVKTMRLIGRIIGGLLLTLGAYLIITIVRGIFMTGMSLGGT